MQVPVALGALELLQRYLGFLRHFLMILLIVFVSASLVLSTRNVPLKIFISIVFGLFVSSAKGAKSIASPNLLTTHFLNSLIVLSSWKSIRIQGPKLTHPLHQLQPLSF